MNKFVYQIPQAEQQLARTGEFLSLIDRNQNPFGEQASSSIDQSSDIGPSSDIGQSSNGGSSKKSISQDKKKRPKEIGMN